jgi:hypothetical protein
MRAYALLNLATPAKVSVMRTEEGGTVHVMVESPVVQKYGLTDV